MKTIAKLISTALLLAVAAPVSADMTAVYKFRNSTRTMTIEIDEQGTVRGSMSGSSSYELIIADETYSIRTTQAGSLVDRSNDLAAVLAERQAKPVQNMKKLMDGLAPLHLVEHGRLAVGGRSGTAYYMDFGKDTFAHEPLLVISDDPGLRTLRDAMVRQFAGGASATTQLLRGTPEAVAEFRRVLEKGAPLKFYVMELADISVAPISPDRFVLPAPPETRDQIRKRLAEPTSAKAP